MSHNSIDFDEWLQQQQHRVARTLGRFEARARARQRQQQQQRKALDNSLVVEEVRGLSAYVMGPARPSLEALDRAGFVVRNVKRKERACSEQE